MKTGITARSGWWLASSEPRSRCHIAVIAVELPYLLFQTIRVVQMQDDLLQLVCATYNNAMMGAKDPDAAFDRAVEMVERRRPLLTLEGAHRVVSQILEVERELGELR